MSRSNFTKGDINRLGDRIRNENGKVRNETLHELQNYRTSYKDDLATVFNKLCDIKKRINDNSIITYRIKRFESIIGKLDRYPKMKFSRMWDIAGCRCILNSKQEIFLFKELVEKDFEVVKVYDYITKPQKSGYSSLHLFIRDGVNGKVIELQLRNQFQHNWATLVEISDLIFEANLKEYGENKDLFRFHQLLAMTELNLSEKKEFAAIISKFNYFEKLGKIFSRNYLKVREQWVHLRNLPRNKFFLIETTKDSIPTIESFQSFREAENKYFKAFLSNDNANIVLTQIIRVDYKQISTAYSNYILTMHAFFDNSLLILQSLVIESIKKNDFINFNRYFKLYSSQVASHLINMIREISFAKDIFDSIQSKRKRRNKRKKNKEWEKDLSHQFNRLLTSQKKFKNELDLQAPKFIVFRYFFRVLIARIEKKNKDRIESTVSPD